MLDDQEFISTQPVRVLEGNVLAWFEGKYPEFRQELEEIGRKYGNVRTIKYFCDEAPILGHKEGDMTPYVKIANGEIALHETFLSYIWALSYAFLVIFDERMQRPRIGKQPAHGMPLGHFVDQAYSVLDYGLSLLTEFHQWPKALPSPESYSADDKFYVERANGIYLAAVDFVLCHELGHIACGHLGRASSDPVEIKEFEQEADQWALARVRKGIRPPERTYTMVGFGAIAGLGSLLFLKRELTSDTHPDKDERIINVLTSLSIDDEDNLWGIAAAFFIVWNEYFKGDMDVSGEYNTYKDLIQAIREQLQPLKRHKENGRMRLD
jgi:hypothetical protein